MNLLPNSNRNAHIKPTARSPFVAWSCMTLLAIMVPGCATPALEGNSIDVVSRNNSIVSHGDIFSAFPGLRTIVINIDRRTYMGNIEPTAANDTFGFNQRYGPGRYAASPPAISGRDVHYKAILSSTDHFTLRCDLTHNQGKPRDGLCLDDFGRVYDVMAIR